MKKIILSLLAACVSTSAYTEIIAYECKPLDCQFNSFATTINKDGTVAGYYIDSENNGKKVPFYCPKGGVITPITDIDMGQRKEDFPLFIDNDRIAIPEEKNTPLFGISRRIAKIAIEPTFFSVTSNDFDKPVFSFDQTEKQVTILSTNGEGQFLARVIHSGILWNERTKHYAYFDGSDYKMLPVIKNWKPVSIWNRTIVGTKKLQKKEQIFIYDLSPKGTRSIETAYPFQVNGNCNNLLFGQSLLKNGRPKEGVSILISDKISCTSMGELNPTAMNVERTAIGTIQNKDGKSVPAIYFKGNTFAANDIAELGNLKEIVNLNAINEQGCIVGVALDNEEKKCAIVLHLKQEPAVWEQKPSNESIIPIEGEGS